MGAKRQQVCPIFVLGALLGLVSSAFAEVPPSSVLVLVNDLMPPEQGTNKEPASVFLGNRYSEARSIPKENVLHLQLRTDESMPWSEYEAKVVEPVKRFVDKGHSNIAYIVPVYGVPYKVDNLPSPRISDKYPRDGYSLDSFLSATNSTVLRPWLSNPYHAYEVLEEKLRFHLWPNSRGWKQFIVTRLDGPSAESVRRLIDRTIEAETVVTRESGVGYYDYRNLKRKNGSCPDDFGGYCTADESVLQAYQLSGQHGFRSVLNDQMVAGSMLKEAPETLWAWGWYSENTISGEYQFVPGAVGAQLTSFTANHLRSSTRTSWAGSWVPRWIESGITATWGATNEPYTNGYAFGNILLDAMWRGYNFGEASYLASPSLNWMMVFVGDPLYSPKIFRSTDRVSPEIVSARISASSGSKDEPVFTATWSTDEPADSRIEFGASEAELQSSGIAPALVKHHSITGVGKPAIVRVVSRDREGNVAIKEIRP